MRALVVLLIVVFVGHLGSCRSLTPPGTLFDSSPPGAQVIVDGYDSGFATPCMIDLDVAVPHEVSLAMPGYQRTTMVLHPAGRLEVVSWMKGNSGSSGFSSALFLPAWDLLLPLELNDALSPGRIFVRLHPGVEE